VALVDGNDTQLRAWLHLAKKKEVELTTIMDFVHVSEYLRDAGRVFHPKPTPELGACGSGTGSLLLEILRGTAGSVVME
jgi:hypothetical protein